MARPQCDTPLKTLHVKPSWLGFTGIRALKPKAEGPMLPKSLKHRPLSYLKFWKVLKRSLK
jgi:hypothetical protein